MAEHVLRTQWSTFYSTDKIILTFFFLPPYDIYFIISLISRCHYILWLALTHTVCTSHEAVPL